MQNSRLIAIYGVVCVAVLLLLPAASIQAQDDEGVYLLYYEDEYPNRLDVILLSRNVCLEAVLRLNPDLEINNIAYGKRLRLPTDEPCYQYDDSLPGWWSWVTHIDDYPPRLKYYENGQWLDEPYYSDELVYIRNYNGPESVEDIASQYNICVDNLLAENVLLQDFERYRAYAVHSFDVFIPQDAAPCDPNWTDLADSASSIVVEIPFDEITPLFFVNHYNICIEDIRAYGFRRHFYQLFQPSTVNPNPTEMTHIPNDAMPCYNEEGQRLSYYDEMGRRLEEPVYSDFAVYIASPGETLPGIAEQMGVCLIDLLRFNYFPDMPLRVAIELFIPPPRPCPDDIEARLVDAEINDMANISIQINICPEDLLPLNPHFSQSTGFLQTRTFSWNFDNWILIPEDADPCYWQYHPRAGDSIFEIERALNVCYQAFWPANPFGFGTIIPHDDVTLHIRFDALPCYNEEGQRLRYPELQYVDMPIHNFQLGDTIYSISQQYNVCVRDLLIANPRLAGAMPTGYPTFIPQTRPCYDDITGMPLIYEDEDGNPLPQPQVSEQLIYYGSQPWGFVSRYYNICMNRLADANRAKLEREASYLGWIIPTDRPPCYDAYGSQIHYVCYTQPMDFSMDYSQIDELISFDIDGTYCYDLSKPDTVVWHGNKPYRIIHYHDTMLRSLAFTAWCFGVSLEEIDAINDDAAILSVLPFQSRAIPLPTRECYLQNADVLNGYELHRVESGETLISIAGQYDKPYQWIARANDLDERNMIWAGQMLIIPAGPTLSSLYLLAGGFGALVILGMWLVYRRWRRGV